LFLTAAETAHAVPWGDIVIEIASPPQTFVFSLPYLSFVWKIHKQ
jgi:hypothetical protein